MARKNCWEVLKCNETTKQTCPAFKENRGTECWEVTGTLCRGETQGTMAEKIGQCRKCKYYTFINRIRFGVGAKLAFGFGLILMLLVSTATVALISLNRTETIYRNVLDGTIRATLEADQAMILAQKAAIGARGYAITGESQEKVNCELSLALAEKKLAALEAYIEGEDVTVLYRNMRAKFNEAKEAMLGLIALKNNSLELAAAGANNHDAEAAVQVWVKHRTGSINAFLTATETLDKQLHRKVQAETDRLEAIVARARSAAVLLVVVALLVGLTFATFLTLSIKRPLALLEARSGEIAAGDLTGEKLVVRNRDETGRLATAFNEMTEALRDMLKRLAVGSSELADVAGQVNASAQQVAATAGETTTTINQVSDGSQSAAKTVQQVADMARKVANHAEKGLAAVERAEDQIRVAEETTERIGTMVGRLGEASGRISQIVNLITGITDQTNLLALNAAIEAARAGKHGRGFAVVAEEVRKLAGQSGQAATEIGEIIKEVEHEIQQVVTAMDAGRQETAKSLTVVSEAGSLFREITRQIEELAEKVQDAAASTEQISASVENIAAASEEQTATVEELSAAAASLSELAESLRALAGRYRF
ncbi:methyl-accepting chemotaxis protein [Desulfofundulus salinus]|uniref:HAMP domain-containing protein n=1 Tax=Desulfofundulus salinus TaxID=2419843 RepID=A0A494X2C4_9FIRM|nr:methyl-accepting chemotaxis protein [Desulfofundulus salinum]RKO67050.1 HAMP domain-containing protein [Desulfofundulus salinum]